MAKLSVLIVGGFNNLAPRLAANFHEVAQVSTIDLAQRHVELHPYEVNYVALCTEVGGCGECSVLFAQWMQTTAPHIHIIAFSPSLNREPTDAGEKMLKRGDISAVAIGRSAKETITEQIRCLAGLRKAVFKRFGNNQPVFDAVMSDLQEKGQYTYYDGLAVLNELSSKTIKNLMEMYREEE